MMVLLLLFAAWMPGWVAAAHPPNICVIFPDVAVCQVEGDPGGGSEGELVAAGKVWSGWRATGSLCGPEARPRLLRFLVFGDGPLAGQQVHVSQFAMASGDPVPNAPATASGAPAVFAADGYVYDLACGSGYPGFLEAVAAALPTPTLVTNPAEAITGLESWFWSDMAERIGPLRLTWTEPASGAGFELDAEVRASGFEWRLGDGTVVVTATGGDGSDPPGSAAVVHVYEDPMEASVSLTVSWGGTYRIRQRTPSTGPWSPPLPISGVWSPTVSRPLIVHEVRSVLIP